MAHALLGPSSASRWMACPPSARLTENMEDIGSEYAKEGSLAHAIAELKLKKKIVEPGMSTKKFNSEMKKLKEQEFYQEEMQGFTDEYIDFINEQLCNCVSTPFISIEQKVDFSEYIPEGYGTADCIILSGNNLHVIDFKYGKGVPVYAEENKQMLLYALGAYLGYKCLYDIKQIKMSIVQPRIANFSSWECDINYLLDFAEEARIRANMAYNGEGELNSGMHCQFCKISATCKKRVEDNLELERYNFKEAVELSSDEIGEILKRADNLVQWVKKLKDYVLAQSLAGNEISGWKAVNGRGTRVFKDTEEAISVLVNNGIEEAILKETTYKSLSQIEKAIGKKDFNSLVGHLIEIKLGAPTLVEESDKRQAITNRIKAEDEFSAVSDINNL